MSPDDKDKDKGGVNLKVEVDAPHPLNPLDVATDVTAEPISTTQAPSTSSLPPKTSTGWTTLAIFCELAKISYPTGLRWCKLGQIEYIQVGGQKRITLEEISRFMQEGTRPPKRPAKQP